MILIFDKPTILNLLFIMKKLLLPLMVLATMFACTSPEKKADAVASNSEDTESGTYVSMDDKVEKIKKVLDAAHTLDTTLLQEVFVDTLRVLDGRVGNVDSLDQIKASPGGRAEFIQGEKLLHDLYDDIAMTTRKGDIKTFTYSDGRVVSGYWGVWSGKGKFTKQAYKIPLHMVMFWKGDKVTHIYRMFDPSALNAEVAASQKK
jgi:hypothetical protein